MGDDELKTWTVRSKYRVSDIVYLRVCDEKKRGMVTAILIGANNAVSYWVTWASNTETRHYDCELSSEFVPVYEDSQ